MNKKHWRPYNTKIFSLLKLAAISQHLLTDAPKALDYLTTITRPVVLWFALNAVTWQLLNTD